MFTTRLRAPGVSVFSPFLFLFFLLCGVLGLLRVGVKFSLKCPKTPRMSGVAFKLFKDRSGRDRVVLD